MKKEVWSVPVNPLDSESEWMGCRMEVTNVKFCREVWYRVWEMQGMTPPSGTL